VVRVPQGRDWNDVGEFHARTGSRGRQMNCKQRNNCLPPQPHEPCKQLRRPSSRKGPHREFNLQPSTGSDQKRKEGGKGGQVGGTLHSRHSNTSIIIGLCHRDRGPTALHSSLLQSLMKSTPSKHRPNATSVRVRQRVRQPRTPSRCRRCPATRCWDSSGRDRRDGRSPVEWRQAQPCCLDSSGLHQSHRPRCWESWTPWHRSHWKETSEKRSL
jgi:hypothetical protein